jgi:hypothetical protein
LASLFTKTGTTHSGITTATGTSMMSVASEMII